MVEPRVWMGRRAVTFALLFAAAALLVALSRQGPVTFMPASSHDTTTTTAGDTTTTAEGATTTTADATTTTVDATTTTVDATTTTVDATTTTVDRTTTTVDRTTTTIDRTTTTIDRTTTSTGTTGAMPTNKDQCKKGGYAAFGFRNQGQCVSWVARNRSS